MNESSDIKTSEAEYIDNINVGGAPPPPPPPPPPKPRYTPPSKNNLEAEINKRKERKELAEINKRKKEKENLERELAERKYNKTKSLFSAPAITESRRLKREERKEGEIQKYKETNNIKKKATAIIEKRGEKERKLNKNTRKFQEFKKKKNQGDTLNKEEKKEYKRVKESSERKKANVKQEQELEKLALNRKLKEAKKDRKVLGDNEKKRIEAEAKVDAKKTMDKIKTDRARKSVNYDKFKRNNRTTTKALDKIDKGTNYVPGMKKLKKTARKTGNSLQRKRETWSKMKSSEKVDFIFDLIRKYLFKPLLLLIAIIITITVAKYIRGLYKRFPRAFTIRNFLDISSKYDKSTGLDIELAESLSRALTDYIYLPPKIMKTINDNSINFMKKNSASNNNSKSDNQEFPYINYIKSNLFEKYNINNNNKLYKLLRCFIEKSDQIFDSGYININDDKFKTNNVLKKEFDNKFFKNYFNKSKNLSEPIVNKFLIEYYKNITLNNPDYEIVNTKLDSEPILNFIRKLVRYTNTVDINTEMSISYDTVLQTFDNILKTSSLDTNNTENVKDIFKNIFLRNVLYMIINVNSNTISDHLRRLENENIISYINPTLYKNNEGIDLFRNYGKYLYLNDNNGNIQSFNNIIDNQKLQINNKIFRHYSGPVSITNTAGIDNSIKASINNEINKLNIGDNTYNYAEYLKYVNKTEVFKILEKYNKNNSSNFDYNADYEQYKKTLEKIQTKHNYNDKVTRTIITLKRPRRVTRNIKKTRGYDTGNAILNDYHKDNKGNKIDDKFNINKVDKKDKCILEIYNILYMLEIMKDNINNGNINSINFSNYLYYLEKYTTLKYYNSDTNQYKFLFYNDKIKYLFIKYFIEIQEKLLYIKDKHLINTALFTTLIHYSPISDEENVEKLLSISRFFMSFTELKLADNFINDVNQYKGNRVGYNFFKDYAAPKSKYLFVDIIIKKFLWEQWDIEKMREMGKPFGSTMISKLTNECVWFSTPLEKEIMKKIGINCKEGMVVEHMFGFLKGLTKLPGLFTKMPKMLESFIKLIGKIFQFIGFFFVIFGYIGRLGLFGLIMLLIKTIFYVCVLIVSAFLYFPFIFLWVSPLIILLVSARYGNPTWLLYSSKILQFFINHFMWVMLAMFVDLPIIDVLGVFAYSIILLGITVFKSVIILAIIFILIIVGIFVLVMDSLSPNKGGFSRFLYRIFVSCENSPFAWYKNSRYDLENKCSRGFFCNLNCGTNYRLSENGMYCERAPTNVPYFCPQPLLYKTYRDDKIKGKKKILSFFINRYPKILLSDSDKQIEFIFNYQKNKSEYYQKCNTFANGDGKYNKKGYNAIGKSVCASAHNIKDEDIKKDIKDICHQTYCSNGKYENFCYKYDETQNKLDLFKFLNNEKKYIELLKKTLFVVVLVALINYLLILIKKYKSGEIIIYNNRFTKTYNDFAYNLDNIFSFRKTKFNNVFNFKNKPGSKVTTTFTQ